MSLLENMIDQAFSRLDAGERMALMQNVIARAIGELSSEERRQLLDHVVENFMAGLTPEQQSALVREVLPVLLGRLLRAGNMSVDDFIWAAVGSLGALSGTEKVQASTAKEQP